MADRAVLAHHVLVLEHDPGAGAVALVPIGRAGEVDHLIGLDPAGAGIDRIGTDAGQVVDLERGDLAIGGERDPPRDPVIAGVDVGDEGFQAVGDELDRAPQQHAQRHGRYLVRVDVDLDAERAADVPADHPDVGRGDVEMARDDVLHHVRRLERVVDREPLLGRVVVGEDRARLQRDAGVAAEVEGVLDHRRGVRERAIDVADVELALEGEVVAELGVDHRRGRVERALHVGDRRQLLELDRDQLERVLGRPPASSRPPPRPARPASRRARVASGYCGADLIPWRCASTPTQGVQSFGDLGAGHDPDHAGAARCRRGLDAPDPRMGQRAR